VDAESASSTRRLTACRRVRASEPRPRHPGPAPARTVFGTGDRTAGNAAEPGRRHPDRGRPPTTVGL
jgi:hypothetical protein